MKQFALDNQDAFRYGVMEEFGLRDDTFEEEEIISRQTISEQNKGIGYAAWCKVEEINPNVDVWETYTPYFENKYTFYVNRCGFHIVEFFNQKHKDPYVQEDELDEMFRFEKVMHK